MLLTTIQDEMHRRAISYNRDLRVKSSLSTELLRMSGVGSKKANLLLRTFKSVKKIKDASLDEIMSVPGIDNKTAKNVYEYLILLLRDLSIFGLYFAYFFKKLSFFIQKCPKNPKIKGC